MQLRIPRSFVALGATALIALVIGCGGGGGGGGSNGGNGGNNGGTTGQLYISDTLNNRIVRVSNLQGGAGWTVFSTGQFVPTIDPNGVSVDSQGRIYFTLFNQNRIARVNGVNGGGFVSLGAAGVNEVQEIVISGPGAFRLQLGVAAGTPLTGLLNENSTAAQIEAAIEGLASVSPSGVTVTDMGGGVFDVTFDSGPLSGTNVPLLIAKDSGGVNGASNVTIATLIQGSSPSGSGIGEFNGPFATAVDSQDRIYVVDRGNNRIVRMNDITGAGWVEITGLNMPNSIAISGNTAYVADAGNHQIVAIDITGANFSVTGSYGTAGTGIGQFGVLGQIAVDSSGRIYVVDSGNSRIVRIDNMTGAGWVTYGSAGSGTGQFTVASGIAVDSSGRIYVSDESLDRVIRINDMSGTGWITLGTSGSGNFQFNHPGLLYWR